MIFCSLILHAKAPLEVHFACNNKPRPHPREENNIIVLLTRGEVEALKLAARDSVPG